MAWLLVALLLPMCASAMRCEGRITRVGDHLVQVREVCGEPFWTDQYSQWLVVGEGGALEQRREHLVEVWYYNFGSNRLMQRLVFLDGRLQREDELGYGFDHPPQGCDPDRLPIGISNGEIVARCGLPMDRRQLYGESIRRDSRGNALARERRQEEWIYGGRNARSARALQLLDGRLVQVQRLR